MSDKLSAYPFISGIVHDSDYKGKARTYNKYMYSSTVPVIRSPESLY